MWGVTTNPFVKENTIMDETKYLKTKTGSIEDAVITSLNTSPNENPHNTRPLLHLPKKKYLESKENSLEQMAINALAEKTDKVNPKELKGKLKDREDADIDNDGDVDQSDRFLHKRRKAIHKKSNEAYNPDTHTSVGSKQKIKPQFNTKTHKLITLPNGNVKVVPKSTRGMEAEALDKGVGSAAYANYAKNITPGEEGDPKIASRQARVQALAQRMTKKLQQRQAAVIDDAYHFESVEDAIDALPPEMVKEEELSTDERKSLPDSAFVFPKERKYPINDIDHARAALSMGARHATASEYAKIKGAVKKKYPEIDVGGEKKEEVELGRIDMKEYLRKTDDAEWDPKLRKGSFRRHKNVKREIEPIKTASVEIHPESVDKPEQGKVYALTGKSGTASIARGDSWKKSEVKTKTKQANVAYDTARQKAKMKYMKKEEVELDELSKGTLGRYVKRATTDAAHAGIDLGVSSQKKGGQTRKDVDTHVGKLVKRQRGIGKAVDKLSKEEVEVDEAHSPKDIERLQKQKARQREKYVAAKKIARQNTAKMNPEEVEFEVDEDRSATLVTTRTVLKPSLKGMSKKAKAILRFKDNQAKRIQNKDNRAPGEDLIK
jgi:hypothetical protein